MAPPWTLELLDAFRDPDSAGSIPPRPEKALSGSDFMKTIDGVEGAERERLILEQLQQGNIPDFLRDFQRVNVTFIGAEDKMEHKATFFVMPDCLAIGSNEDHVLIPMTPRTAEAFAAANGLTLPTAKMVDDTFKNADVQITTDPRSTDSRENLTRQYWRDNPRAQDDSSSYAEHDQAIQDRYQAEMQRRSDADYEETPHTGNNPPVAPGRGEGPVLLTAGHKKELVLADASHFGKGEAGNGELAFYGFYKDDGTPIQGSGGIAQTAHDPNFVDYSHGARMVDQYVWIDGNKKMKLTDAVADPNFYKAFSNEGQMKNAVPWHKP
jgi:hypothetical protein